MRQAGGYFLDDVFFSAAIHRIIFTFKNCHFYTFSDYIKIKTRKIGGVHFQKEKLYITRKRIVGSLIEGKKYLIRHFP